MAFVKFDDIDLAILRELQADGRMTNVKLAQRVGLTAPPCLRRVRSLEKAGVIEGYHADLDGTALGYSITVFAMISLTTQADSALKEFEAHIANIPEVRECHMLNGEIDYLIKIVAQDLRSFQALLTSQLTSAPHVASVKTSLTIRRSKYDPGYPID